MTKHRRVTIFCSLILIAVSLQAQTLNWSLQQCIDSAIAYNLNIGLANNTIALNAVALKQSKNNLLPSINGNLGEELSVGRTVNATTGAYQTGTAWTTAAGLSMNQNIFSGLQYLNAIKQSQLVYQASKYDLDDAKFNLTISIINAYLQVLYTHEAIAIAQNQVSSDSLQLQTVLNLVDVGKKTESDMLQIKSQMVADKYTVTNNISQWKLAKVNLQQLINIPVNETFNINYASITGPALNNLDNVSDIYAGSLAYQPIVKSYALKTQSAAYSVLIAKGAYYPQLVFKSNLGTSYSSAAKQTSTTVENTLQTIGYLQSNPSSLVLGDVPQAVTTVNNYPFGRQLADNLNANFSLTLNIPILNYLQVRNNVRRQKINLQNAELNEQITKVNLRKTIEQVFTGTENAMAQYQSANEEVEATRAAYDVASAKFDDGKIIATDLLVQKNAYIKALSDLLQAKYGLLFNRGILDYYRGTPFTF